MTLREKAGFTLIELLFVVIILAIIIPIIYGTLFQGIRLVKKTESCSDKILKVGLFFQKLQSDLENMKYYNLTNSYPKKESFTFGSDRISFIRPIGGVLKYVSYFLSEKGTSVVRTEKDFVDFLNDQGKEIDKKVSLIDVRKDSLRFFYAKIKNGNGEYFWDENWRYEKYPALVRVKIDICLEKMKSCKAILKEIFNPSGILPEIKN